MKAILELPPGLTMEQLQALLNDRIRDLNFTLSDVVESPALENVDIGTHRVINLADPSNDLDAVNLRTLKKFLALPDDTATLSGAVQPLIEPRFSCPFTFVNADGTPTADLVAGDETNDFIIPRGWDGPPAGWDAFCEIAPTGSSAVVDILLNEVTVFSSTKLVIPSGSIALQKGTGFISVTFKAGDKLRARVVNGGTINPGQGFNAQVYWG